jgi:SHS2 domain-containing protein
MYQFLEHTADIRMVVKGKTIKDIFLSALKGMFYFLKPVKDKNAKTVKRKISLKSLDQTTLLIDFLNNALYLAYSKKEAYDKIVFSKINNNNLSCQILGYKISAFKKDIKAVTYHEANIKKLKNGIIETVIIFDI